MSGEKRCIGFGKYEGSCGATITDDDLKLNRTGLWCQRCEEARRSSLDAQFDAVTKSFEAHHA